MKGKKRIVALLLCVLTLVGLMPTAAFAAEQSVTIESQSNSAFDYLEYYSEGGWHDLNTPKHTIEQTGEVAYCVEHRLGNPHGDGYTAASPSSVFSQSTLRGLYSIFIYGYPCNTPSGFTADEARQATANAIRFWLSEQGEGSNYNFTNRKTNPTKIRAKSGYEHVLTWADDLLGYARAGSLPSHGISMSPTNITLSDNGSKYTGTVKVSLNNLNAGYTLNQDALPSGGNISGYTGSKTETLTITVPYSAAGKNFSLSVKGYDTRNVSNITAYIPADDDLQRIFLCATTKQSVASANVSVSIPAYGNVQIEKVNEDGTPLAGVKLGIYSDSACTKKLAEVTTDSKGIATSADLTAGTVYVKELSTVSPYILDTTVKKVTVEANKTTKIQFVNEKATGKIVIEKTASQLTGTNEISTDYGKQYAPVFSVKGLAGVVFEVKNSSGTVVATLKTDANGKASVDKLPLGDYTVIEKSTVTGYIKDDTVHKVSLKYKNQTTPVVSASISVENLRQQTSISMKKLTEAWNDETLKFEVVNGESFVFGLYTAEAIGVIPKGTMVDVLVTDKDGVAKTTVELPFGNYILKELAVPHETILMNKDSFPLTLNGDTPEVIHEGYFTEPIMNDMFKANIAIIKSDEDNETRMLEGAVYEITNADGKKYCTMATDADGYAASIDLPVGKYFVREITPPTGFIVSDEVIEVDVTLDNKATIVYERTNKGNEVTLRKTDITTGKPVAGAVIEIYDKDGEVYFAGKTDENGEITLKEIPAGTYTYKETIAPVGFALNTETFEFTMDHHGKVTGMTEITDEPITLKLTKMNNFTGKGFADVEFTLVKADGTVVKTSMTEDGYRVPDENGSETFKVDAKGYAEFRYLPEGEYKFIENTPVGYISEDEYSFKLTDADSYSKPYTMTVENDPTGLKILKVDAKTGNPLTGAGFRIKMKDGLGFETLTFTQMEDGSYFFDEDGTVMDMMVDVNGEIILCGLPLGDVWIEESIVPEGYFPISAQKAEITKETSFENPLVMEIENSVFVKLGMDSDWWEFPALMLGIALALGGVVTLIVVKRKKKDQEV